MQQKNIQALRAEHERREVEYARSMQRVFPPELFDAVKSNIDKLEKLGVQGEFKRDFEIKVSDLEWVMDNFLTRAVINEDYAGKLGACSTEQIQTLTLKESHPSNTLSFPKQDWMKIWQQGQTQMERKNS